MPKKLTTRRYLNEIYTNERITLLERRIRRKQLLDEHYALMGRILNEQVDERTLNKVLQFLGNVNTMIGDTGGKLKTLKSVVDAARTDATAALKAKGRKRDKLVGKLFSFSTALAQGLRQLPSIVDLVGTETFGGTVDDEKATQPMRAVINDPNAQAELEDLFARSFGTKLQKPPTMLGQLANLFADKMPYVKGEINDLTDEMLNLSYNELQGLADRAGGAKIDIPGAQFKKAAEETAEDLASADVELEDTGEDVKLDVNDEKWIAQQISNSVGISDEEAEQTVSLLKRLNII